MAALEGKTIRQFALEKLFPPATDEDRAWAELKTLIERRIEESAAGAVSRKTFDEIVEEELATGDGA
jgi:Antitoxin ParD